MDLHVLSPFFEIRNRGVTVDVELSPFRIDTGMVFEAPVPYRLWRVEAVIPRGSHIQLVLRPIDGTCISTQPIGVLT